MSVDIASLVFEIDSTQAATAEKQLDSLIDTGARVDAMAQSVKASTGQMAAGFDAVGTSAQTFKRNATDLAAGQGAVEKALSASTAATGAYLSISKDAATQLALNIRLNQQRASEAAASAKAEAAAALQVQKAQDAAAKTAASLATQVDAIRSRLDPLAAVQIKAAASAKTLDQALAAGVITQAEYAALGASVAAAAEKGALGLANLSTSTKLSNVQMQELEHVARSAFDALSAGANPFRVLAMEGGRTAQALGASEGGIGGALSTLAGLINPVVVGVVGLSAVFVAAVVGVVQYNAELAKLTNLSNGVGAAVSLSAQQIMDAATQIATDTGKSYSAASASIMSLAQSGKVSSDFFVAFGDDVGKYAAATGLDAVNANKELAAALIDPAKNLGAVNDRLDFLTQSQMDYIVQLQKSGDLEKADAVILGALGDRMKGIVPVIGVVGGIIAGISDAWHDATAALSGYLKAFLELQSHLVLPGSAGADANTAHTSQAFDAALAKIATQERSNAVGRSDAGSTVASQYDASGDADHKALLEQQQTLIKGISAARDVDTASLAKQQNALAQVNVALKQQQRAYDAGTTPAIMRANLIAKASVDADLAKTASAKAAAAAERVYAEAFGVPTDHATLVATANNASAVAGAKGSKLDDSAAKKALEQEATGQQAIDTAQKAEIAARAALTKNIEDLAQLQADEVTQETKKAVDKLEEEVAQKKITAGAALVAEALDYRVQTEKTDLIARQAQEAIDNYTLAQSQKIAGYDDQIAKIKAGLATNAADQNAIEDAALAERQQAALAQLAHDQAQQKANDQGNDADRAATLAKLKDVQAAEQAQQGRADESRIQTEQNSIAQAGLTLQSSLLTSQQGLALSTYAQGQIGLKLLALKQQQETLVQQAIVDSATASDKDKKNAADTLALLPEIHKNQTDALKASNTLLDGFSEASQALGDMASDFKRGDFGAGVSSLGSALKDASGLLGKGSGLGGVLGSIGKALGPIGGIITGVTSVLGALFGGDSTVGVAHLSGADQQKLQGAGSVLSSINDQSASIANSLATATKYQNADLDYSSQQVDVLKEINSGIGALTASLGTQLGLGGALDTTNLGLGTSANKGFLGLIGASSTSTSLVDQGINLGQGSLQDYISGAVNAAFYQDLQTVKTSSGFLGIGGGTKTTNSETTSDAGSDITSQIASIVGNLKTGVLDAASKIGIDGAQAALDAFQVNIGRISFDGLDATQITAQLNAVFSKLGDQLAGDVIPQFASLQQAGEGALETLERLATEYQAVDDSLASIGTTFGSFGADSVAMRDALVQASGGLDTFTSQAQFFNQNFLTAAQQLAPIQASVSAAFAGMADQLAALGDVAPTTKAEFVSLVDSLDLSTQGGQDLYVELMNIAPAFAKVADAANDNTAALSVWTDAYQNATNAVSTAQSNLNAAYSAAQTTLSGTISTFQGIADTLATFRTSLDTTDAGGGSLGAQYSAAKAAFDANTAATQGDPNDPVTQAALNDQQSTDQAFLDISKQTSVTQAQYDKDVAAVKAATAASEAFAQRQVDIAQSSLDALNASVASLGVIDNSVQTVAQEVAAVNQAILALAAAQAAQTKIGTMTDPQWGSIANVDTNQKLASDTGYSGTFGTGGFEAWITQQDPATQAIARQILTDAGEANRIVGFASGGYHTGGLRLVGENGPEIEATGPSRIWSATDTQRMLAGNDNDAVCSKLDAILAAIQAGNANTAKSASLLDSILTLWRRVTLDGNSLQVTEYDEAA